MPFQPHENKPPRLTSPLALLVALLACACLALTAGPAESASGKLTLTIAHINDLHAHLTPSDLNGQLCAEPAAPECFGGAPRIKAAVDALRARNEPLLVLDAGDQFQGTLFYTLFKGQAIAAAANAIGFDAMTLGNHEFDDGPSVLADYLERLEPPMLAANVQGDDPRLLSHLAPYRIFEFAGRKVAVVGLANEESSTLSSPGPKLRFLRAEEALPPVIDELRRQGVAHVIALTHLGVDRDQQIAASVPGLTAVVGGHSHTYLSGTDPKAQGPYPILVKGPGGRTVPVVQAWSWGRVLGTLTLELDDGDTVVQSASAPLPLDASLPEDQALAADLRAYAARFKPYLATKAGVLLADAGGSAQACRQGECAIGDLAAEAMLDAARPFGAVMAVTNAGGIRADLPGGDVTLAALLTVFPFSNTIDIVTLKGQDLREALEYGVSLSESGDGRGTGRFLQLAGLRLTFDPDRPAGSRVLAIETRQPDGSFAALDPSKPYRVALNSYLLNGGDGFTQFAKGTDISRDGPTMDVAIANYLRGHSPLDIRTDGRITKAKGK